MKKILFSVILAFAINGAFAQVNEKELLKKNEEAAAKLFYDYKAIAPTGCDVFHFFNTIVITAF